eukprot:4960430-Pyramimonas_sp.AAC.1
MAYAGDTRTNRPRPTSADIHSAFAIASSSSAVLVPSIILRNRVHLPCGSRWVIVGVCLLVAVVQNISPMMSAMAFQCVVGDGRVASARPRTTVIIT